MNDEQESACDVAPTEDWMECPKCYREVPKHRSHYCVCVIVKTPDMECTPERLLELLYDERRLHKATAAREIALQTRLTASESESEVAGLRALLKRVRCEIDGYIDGAPDCNAVSKLANAVSLIIDPPKM